ncbi:MAG: PDDEXK nuclease domain-containing protein [Planctomycetes bacterium]|nr:PDDEXK nuclease domain-containing protein [Planctomycetota bacterium]
MSNKRISKNDYGNWLGEVKSRIQIARISAARSINRDLILLYWDIGKSIVEKQEQLGWGKSVVDRLSRDLGRAFPDVGGLSSRNLWDMRRLYSEYSNPSIWRDVIAKIEHPKWVDPKLRQPVAELENHFEGSKKLRKPAVVAREKEVIEILRQAVAELPWGHNLMILNKVTDPVEKLFYVTAATKYGWTRNVLLNQINSGAYRRSGKKRKTHNFALVLPGDLAEQTEEMLKSSYSLEFLGISEAIKERELENLLIENLKNFILELGYGFCFVGRQYRLSLGRKDYFVDLLFYHRFLKCLVAIDIKIEAFAPEFSGKMDFYLNLLNEKEKTPDDNPSVGMILCAEKDDLEVEFSLKTKNNPIGVAEYCLQDSLPEEFRGLLPTPKEIREALGYGHKKRRKANQAR